MLSLGREGGKVEDQVGNDKDMSRAHVTQPGFGTDCDVSET